MNRKTDLDVIAAYVERMRPLLRERLNEEEAERLLTLYLAVASRTITTMH